MKKTLYIQIDNNSLPKGCGEDVEVLDCRCINDFCSFVGDALVGDLKDDNGKPFWQLITPVGKLLMDFKDVDEKSFNSIIDNWYDILGNMLHNGIQGDEIEIMFPQQYVDWLLHNDNYYYEQVSKELQKANGKIALSTKAIDRDMIASLNDEISHALQGKKEEYSLVVFSNPMIRNSSFVVKRIRLEGIEFMRYDSWMESLAIQKLEEETANQKSFNVNGVSFEMIKVEGGTFMMGATSEQGSDAYDWEKPAHSVTVSDFWIGETEVTQALWQAVMGSNPSYFKGSNRPVEQVSWNDCQTFVNKLNSLLSGQLPAGHKFRLPTEAEWEYAARGGNRSGHYKYSGSNNLGSVAWYEDNSGITTHDVKTKNSNELGIYDMSGNVWEWCQDLYGSSYYGNSPQSNPTGPSSGSDRVYRGGSWFLSAGSCRVSSRGSSNPSLSYNGIGLRVAL